LICQYVVFFHLVFFHWSRCKKNYKFRIYNRLIDVSRPMKPTYSQIGDVCIYFTDAHGYAC
jgi:hypothetical protein